MDKRGYYVADSFRTNHLSMKPGGYTLKVVYSDHFRLYDKIKYPKAYIDRITTSDPNIMQIECEGKIVWQRKS